MGVARRFSPLHGPQPLNTAMGKSTVLVEVSAQAVSQGQRLLCTGAHEGR